MGKGIKQLGWFFASLIVSANALAFLTKVEPAVHPILKEAQDHVVVLPEKSLAILREHADLLKDLSQSEQVLWHMTTLRAALPVAELDAMVPAFNALAPLQDEQTFIHKRAFYLNSMGAWMRRNSYYASAKLAYFCSIDHALENADRLRSLLNLAVVERNRGNKQEAKALNLVALNIAKLEKKQAIVASIENNLGIIALTEGELEVAAEHFKQALDINRRLIRRSSEILSGINLLQTFVRLEQYTLYERLYPRVNRMAERFGVSARAAYLDWVHSVYLHRTSAPLSPEDKQRLTDSFHNLNDVGIQNILLPFTAELHIDVNVPSRISEGVYHGELMEQVNFCDWDHYQDMSYDVLLDKIAAHVEDTTTL